MFLGDFNVPLMVIQIVSLNSKLHSFLVRILVRKDNTDNKPFKREFHTKETRKKGIEKIKCCKFLVQLARNLFECPGNKVLWIWVFFFSFFVL